ncbi:MAG: eukaryotic-like serine/threonine-protein kinase [Thermoleophilaceae bacterium]|nr:eukaryotic-like serine/threonine-protein kinase [Thermoleophilaceae bacterium]
MAEVAEGTIVDGRYRVQRRIGSGGMADVYLADDSQLGREVALKVLHRRFARDREFVERFRREASAAAGLQHPNVVSVFDRGEYDGTYYIAMEYLPGRTLKDLIREEAPLDQQRVIGLAIQILQAAAFAHRRGVIHRDFKPHNVIVGPDDRLKVTDFGIARAGASEMTETGSIMGTAQYLSPEQAQGQRVGAPSDLYSIGIVLYEMLAGRVPFGGDSAVSIALKHVSDVPPRLRDLRPDVHPRLEQAVGRALLKDPAQRYASADEFIAALEQARAAMSSGDNGAPVGTSTWVPPVIPDDDERDQRGARWPWILLVLLLLGLVAAAAILQPWSGPAQRTVPTVVGATAKRAKAVLSKAGFRVKTHGVESEETPGRVVAQDPGGGTKVDEHSTVDLAVSSGPGRQLVPSVANLPARQAQRELNAAGFKVTQDVQPSTTVADGLAIRTSPKEGKYAPKGANVRLIVSSGPPPVTVPSVIGQDKNDARATLEDAGLQVIVQPADSNETKDQVIGQDPGGGTSVDQGSRVTLTVSRGPQKVDVPDVVGDDVNSAKATLESAGFKVSVKQVPSTEVEGTVIGQSPNGGARAIEGSSVTLTVAKAQNGASGGTQPPDTTPGGNGGEGNGQQPPAGGPTP